MSRKGDILVLKMKKMPRYCHNVSLKSRHVCYIYNKPPLATSDYGYSLGTAASCSFFVQGTWSIHINVCPDLRAISVFD